MVGSVLSGVKISAAVSASGSSNSTLYTVPANSFTIFQVAYAGDSGEGCQITVGSQTVVYFSGTATATIPQLRITATDTVSGVGICGPFFAGPGQAIAIANVTGSISARISGVTFINTP